MGMSGNCSRRQSPLLELSPNRILEAEPLIVCSKQKLGFSANGLNYQALTIPTSSSRFCPEWNGGVAYRYPN